MRLSQLLQSNNNSLDSFRILAALLVIYGHTPTFISNQPANDFIVDWLGFDYSGSLAVKFFFMLSGLLVTHSLLARPHIIPFLIRRAIRIFPALFVCIFLSVFVIGLFMTSLPASDYLLHPQTWSYWLHNSLLIDLRWELPGVFTDGETATVNGSLWTLPLEVMCYISLVVFFASLLRFHQRLACAILFVIISLVFCGGVLWPNELIKFKESLLLGGCFCIGVLFAIQNKGLSINLKGIALGVLLAVLLWQTPLQQLVFYFVFFYVCLYLSGTAFFTKFLKLPGDPSYGIYIYGFVIQQCIANLLPAQGILLHQITAAIIAIGVGYLSWYLIEKPAISFGRKKLR